MIKQLFGCFSNADLRLFPVVSDERFDIVYYHTECANLNEHIHSAVRD